MRSDPCVHLAEGNGRDGVGSSLDRPTVGAPPPNPPGLAARRIFLLIAAALIALAACSCAPPASSALAEHGRAAFDAWIGDNGIRQEVGDLSAYPGHPCGGYRADLLLAVVDDACIDLYTTDPAAHEWVRIHELGHAIDRALDFPQYPGTTDMRVAMERGAQCVAAVVLERSWEPPGMEAAGYWACPTDEVDRTRTLMEAIGAW